MNTRTTPLLYAVVALIAIAIGFYLGLPSGHDEPPTPSITLEGGTALIEHGKPFPGFSLSDFDGQVFDNARLQDRWTMMFFGYTHCPDICPATLSLMRQMVEQMDEAAKDTLQIVFVSVDPERDTLEHLKNYVTYFHPDFLGVTGDEQALLDLTRQLGIVYRKVEVDSDNSGYLVDHSGSIIVAAPNGDWAAVFSMPHVPEVMIRDLASLKQYLEP